jgi:hypothetical protein
MRGTVLILSLLLSTSAQAMTGAEFLDKLNDQQRASYVDGAVEMLAYVMPGDKAKCVFDWYYRGQGPEQLIRALRQNRELPVTGILKVLVKRLCPDQG